ncbi:MAG: NAD(P)H-binding protein [Bacteroidales bacterium]|nr:NAD(P)H-binding protein [Bacteroidales bacterium]
MKLVIFGASGQTGKLLVQQALDRGHEVIAYVRREGAITLEHPKLKVMTGQLYDQIKLHEAIAGADVCFSTLGVASISKRSLEFTVGIDQIVEVMEEEGVKRLIYMSSLGAGESRFLMGPVIRFIVAGFLLRIPLADHNENEKRISQSNLEWTVVRPASLTNGVKLDKVRWGSDFIKLKGNVKIPRANVAEILLNQAESRDYIRKAIWAYE